MFSRPTIFLMHKDVYNTMFIVLVSCVVAIQPFILAFPIIGLFYRNYLCREKDDVLRVRVCLFVCLLFTCDFLNPTSYRGNVAEDLYERYRLRTK